MDNSNSQDKSFLEFMNLFHNGNHSNLSDIIDFDMSEMGWPEPPLKSDPVFRVVMISLYSLVFTGSVLGNLAVILVILCHSRMRSFVNFFLANLAAADLFLGVFCALPNLSIYVNQQWVTGRVACKLQNFVHGLNYSCSIIILTIISLERYLVITKPMWSRRSGPSSRLRITVMGGVWLASSVYSLPLLLAYDTRIPNSWGAEVLPGNQTNLEVTVFCTRVHNEVIFKNRVYVMVNFIVLYVLPLILMTFTYTRVALVLWRSSSPSSNSSSILHTSTTSDQTTLQIAYTKQRTSTTRDLPGGSRTSLGTLELRSLREPSPVSSEFTQRSKRNSRISQKGIRVIDDAPSVLDEESRVNDSNANLTGGLGRNGRRISFQFDNESVGLPKDNPGEKDLEIKTHKPGEARLKLLGERMKLKEFSNNRRRYSSFHLPTIVSVDDSKSPTSAEIRSPFKLITQPFNTGQDSGPVNTISRNLSDNAFNKNVNDNLNRQLTEATKDKTNNNEKKVDGYRKTKSGNKEVEIRLENGDFLSRKFQSRPISRESIPESIPYYYDRKMSNRLSSDWGSRSNRSSYNGSDNQKDSAGLQDPSNKKENDQDLGMALLNIDTTKQLPDKKLTAVDKVRDWRRKTEADIRSNTLSPRRTESLTTNNSKRNGSFCSVTSRLRPSQYSASQISIGNRRSSAIGQQIGSRRKVIRLLVAVVVTFTLCTLPNQLRVQYHEWAELKEVSKFDQYAPPITTLILYFNSCLNPFLYALISAKFRKAFLELNWCFWLKYCRKTRTARNTTSVI